MTVKDTRIRRGRKDNAARFQRNKKYADKIKVQRGCAHCGYNEHPEVLTLDHIVPRSKGGLPEQRFQIGTRSISAIDEMFAHPNLQVLCRNCHVIKNSLER